MGVNAEGGHCHKPHLLYRISQHCCFSLINTPQSVLSHRSNATMYICVWLYSWPQSPDITSLAPEDLIASVLKEDHVYLLFFPGTLLLKGRPKCFQFCQQFSSGISALSASTKCLCILLYIQQHMLREWWDMTTYMGYYCVTLYLVKLIQRWMLSRSGYAAHISGTQTEDWFPSMHSHTYTNIHTTRQCKYTSILWRKLAYMVWK